MDKPDLPAYTQLNDFCDTQPAWNVSERSPMRETSQRPYKNK